MSVEFPRSSSVSSKPDSDSGEDARDLPCPASPIQHLSPSVQSEGKQVEEAQDRYLVRSDITAINPATEDITCTAEKSVKNEGCVEFVMGSFYRRGLVSQGENKEVLECRLILGGEGGEERQLSQLNTNIFMEISN